MFTYAVQSYKPGIDQFGNWSPSETWDFQCMDLLSIYKLDLRVIMYFAVCVHELQRILEKNVNIYTANQCTNKYLSRENSIVLTQ